MLLKDVFPEFQQDLMGLGIKIEKVEDLDRFSYEEWFDIQSQFLARYNLAAAETARQIAIELYQLS